MASTHSQRLTTAQSLQHIAYDAYDLFGNLTHTTHTHTGQSTTEQFQYDNLHRLIQSSRSSGQTVNYTYDPAGNLTHKSDYATTYHYGCQGKPNAVCQITQPQGHSVNFTYDANGNLTQGDGKTVTYTPYNQPATVSQTGVTSTFFYGADQARYQQIKQRGATTETTYYLGTQLEIIHTGGLSTLRYTISDHALLEKTIDLGTGLTHSQHLRYLHRDRLGSITLITDKDGTVLERRSHDPFGKPRDGDGQDKTPPTLNSAHTTRGFTHHEHLDAQQLIHMNGRIYDYNLGRFYSVDPYIQNPENSQSINPYSYIMNNPLSGTDPTGYTPEMENEKVTQFEVKTSRPGSRIKTTTTVTATVTQSNGVTKVTLTGGNGAARQTVQNAMNGRANELGGQMVDYGSRSGAGVDTWNADSPQRGAPGMEGGGLKGDAELPKRDQNNTQSACTSEPSCKAILESKDYPGPNGAQGETSWYGLKTVQVGSDYICTNACGNETTIYGVREVSFFFESGDELAAYGVRYEYRYDQVNFRDVYHSPYPTRFNPLESDVLELIQWAK